MRKLRAVIQLAIGVGLVLLLVWRMSDRGELAGAVATALRHGWYVTFGLLALACGLLLGALRWRVLLLTQGLRLSVARTIHISFVAHFFNCFLLGSTGGDVVKAVYAAGATEDRKAEAVATIAIDRIVGILGLLAFAVAVMLLRLRFVLSHAPTRIALSFFSSLLVAGVAGGVLIFHQDLFERWSLFRRLRDRTRLGGLLARVYKAFGLVARHPQSLISTFLLSLAIQGTVITASAMMGRALEIDLPLKQYATLVPSVSAVGSIPVTPGGLGTRETAATFLFGILGVPAARAVLLSLLVYAGALFWGLVGGVLYMAESIALTASGRGGPHGTETRITPLPPHHAPNMLTTDMKPAEER